MTGFLIQNAPKPILRYVRDNHHCQNCGKCCYCSPIVINGKDIRVIACKLGMNVKEFKKKYTEAYPKNPSVSHFKQEAPCVFLNKNNRCEIYSARPDMCRQYPIRKDGNIPGECGIIIDLLQEIMDEKGNVTTHSLLRAQQKKLLNINMGKEEQCIPK